MARGTLIVVGLLVCIGALVERSCQRTMSHNDERISDLSKPGDGLWRSGVAVVDESAPTLERPGAHFKFVWRLPVL